MTASDLLLFSLPVLIALLVTGLLVSAKVKRSEERSPGPWSPDPAATNEVAPRMPLTPREQSMYFRLIATFPEQVVLAQVAMSALLKTKATSTRATFDRKVIDFVLCSKAFEPLVVIELDDASHASKTDKDAARDALLERAGYCVRRFANVPDEEELQRACPVPSQPVNEAKGPAKR